MYPQSPTVSPPLQRQQRKHWPRRKKIAAFIVACMILTPFLAAGAYVWQIANAIEEAQEHSVVDFPQSQTELGGVSLNHASTATPSASPQADTGQAAPTASPQADTTPAAPAASLVASPPVDTTQAAPTPTQTPKSTTASRGNPGSFGIARDILGTGTRADTIEPADAWPKKDFINVLVLGVDRRATGGDQNADVIMIARVDFTTHEVRVVSIPRDLQVEVPGHGPGKINGAYNIGVQQNPDNDVAGVLMMRDTIEYNFGVPIDEFVLVDFVGFEKVIDAVGGITIVVPERIEDDAYPTEDFGTTTLVIEAGRQVMDGETALAYARTRHQDSDDNRRDRQMLVLRALLDKGQSLGSTTRIAQVINATGDAVLTSIDWDEQLALVILATQVEQDQIVMKNITEPLVTPGTAANGTWIYVGDPAQIAAFIESVLSGNAPAG